MKKENRASSPWAGLTIATILLASTAGYVSALSRMFQAPLALSEVTSNFHFDGGDDSRAITERAQAVVQNQSRPATGWLFNALTASAPGTTRPILFSLDRAGDRQNAQFFSIGNDVRFRTSTKGGTLVTAVNDGLHEELPSSLFVPVVPLVTTTIAWDGGAGAGTAWLTAANWAGDVVPDSDDIAQFDVAGTATTIGINMNGATNNGANNQAVGAIELLSTRNRTIGDSSVVAGTLTLNGATVNGVANTILRNASTFLLTLQNNGGAAGTMDVALGNATDNIINIDGTGGITITSLIKNGAGSKLTFNGNGTGILTIGGAASNTYTGLTTVNVGEMDLSKTAGLNAIAGNLTIGDGVGSANTATVKLINADQIANTSDVTINSDGVLNLNGNNETIDALNSSSPTALVNLGSGTLTVGANGETIFTYAGTSSGTGGLTKAGSGILLLSGTNNYTGATTVKAGELFLTASGSLATGSTILLGDTAPNSPSAQFTFGATGGGETVANAMTVQASASGTEGRRTILGLGESGNTNTYSGVITMNTDLTVQSAAAGGSAANGQGILLFQGGSINVMDNTFIMDSNLRGNNADTYSINGIVTVNEVLGSSLTTGGSVFKEGSGTLILQGTSNTYTGTDASALNANGTRIGGGVLAIFGDGSLGLAPTNATNNVFFVAPTTATNVDSIAPTLRADADGITLSATRNINIASGITARLDSNGFTFDIAGNINGAGNLNKVGPGTLILSSANTYTGTTTVSTGLLMLTTDNALGGTSGITVNSGGTLLLSNTGTNSINNNATMTLNGGTFATGGLSEHGAANNDFGVGPLDLIQNRLVIRQIQQEFPSAVFPYPALHQGRHNFRMTRICQRAHFATGTKVRSAHEGGAGMEY